MIVSRKPALKYCRLTKTASASASSALEGYSSTVECLLFSFVVHKILGRRIAGIFFPLIDHSHLTMQGAREVLEEVFFNRALKFTVCHHPVSWALSYFNHLPRIDWYPRYAKAFEEVRHNGTFEYYLNWLQDREPRPLNLMLAGKEGEFLIDNTLKIETLTQGIN